MIRDDEHRDRGPTGVWDDLSSAVLDRGTIDAGLVARAAELPPDRLRWTIDDLFRRAATLEPEAQDAAAGAIRQLLVATQAAVAPDIDGLVSLMLQVPPDGAVRTHLREFLWTQDPALVAAALDRHRLSADPWHLAVVRDELLGGLGSGGDPDEAGAGGGLAGGAAASSGERPAVDGGTRGFDWGASDSGYGGAEEPPSMAADDGDMAGGHHAEPAPAAESPPVAANGGPAAAPAARNGDHAAGPPRRSRRTRSTRGTKGGAAHRAYGLLRAPDEALVEVPFKLVVGLAKQRPTGVAGGPLLLPPVEDKPYTVDVQLVADTFDLAEGESFKNQLHVSSREPYPTVVLHLTARPLEPDNPVRMLQATFGIGGETLGVAIRTVNVVETASDARKRPTATTTAISAGTPVGERPADVTIEIVKGNEPGVLRWNLRSKHPGVEIDRDSAVRVPIGTEARSFGRDVKAQVQGNEGNPSIGLVVTGLSLIVGEQIPPEVWTAIRSAAAAVGDRPLDILILSQEEHVPWELAAVPDPPLLAGAAPFLGAQANIGRWLLGTPPPDPEPPRRVTAGAIAVVEGRYEGPTYDELPGAANEVEQLKDLYGATLIDPTEAELVTLLRASKPVNVIHFAVHGRADAGADDDGLILAESEDGEELVVLSTLKARAAALKATKPFVFLNACQVGEGRESLGMYGGMAAAFLKAGAAGVVAPIWSIDDEVSHEIALDLYARSLAGGETPPVAAMLREARARFPDNPANSATFVAYQLYGHPSLRLVRATDTP